MRQVGDAWRATPKGRRIALWVARGQAGPTAPLVVEVAASVTPCRQDAGPTVLDEHRHVRARRSAASLRGDVVGTDQIPVPLEGAMGTAEPPALGLGDPPPAGGTGGGGATLIHQPHHDPGLLSLVAQGLEQVGAAPLPQPEVLHPPGVLVGDALEVAHDQGPDLVVDGEGDHLLGRLMLGLMDAAAMARLGPTHPSPMPAPAPRPALPGPRYPACGLGLPGLLIIEMQVAVGAECPPRHQQPRGLGHDGVGVDDPKVHSSDPTPVQVMVLDGDSGGDRQPQPAPISQQDDRPNLLGRVREGAGSRTQSAGWPLATGSRTRWPSILNVP